MPTWVQILVSAFSFVGALTAALFARNQALTAQRMQNTSSPYEALAQRVVVLESKVVVLEEEKGEDRAWIRAMLAWIRLHYPDATHHPSPPHWWSEFGD